MLDVFTGYVPQVGDRVTIQDPGNRPHYITGVFDGRAGTVKAVAPNLSNCQVTLDNDPEWSWVRFFPGEVAPE